MANPQRPAFYEGQILAAADLAGTVEHARARAARHDRYQHDWGIAEGLELTTEQLTDAESGEQYVRVTLRPGVAVDGTGREVVVPEPVVLSEAEFVEVNGSDTTDDPYPVFLAGRDREPVAGPAPGGGCGPGRQPDRIEESYQIIFRRLGDERLVAEQRPPGVAEGPGDGTEPWLILLGYVRGRNRRFIAVLDQYRGVGRRLAGVRAETVSARTGTLTLRSAPVAGEGTAVLAVNGESGLAFGTYRADGSVERLLTVSTRGDLRVTGSVAGQQPAGGVAAVSGTATDGMLLPLPAGVSPDQVADGRVALHVSVTPHPVDPPDDGVWISGPVRCAVDEDRRLRCRVRWVRVDGDGPPNWRDRPAAANFVVLATVSAGPVAAGPIAAGPESTGGTA
jgi:hypothetical protein